MTGRAGFRLVKSLNIVRFQGVIQTCGDARWSGQDYVGGNGTLVRFDTCA